MDGQWAGGRLRAAPLGRGVFGRPLPPPAPPPALATHAHTQQPPSLTSSSRERSPGALSSDASATGSGPIGAGSSRPQVSRTPLACARRPGVPLGWRSSRVWPELGETSSSRLGWLGSRAVFVALLVMSLDTLASFFCSCSLLSIGCCQHTTKHIMASPQLDWAGLFRWSMKHQDGTRPTAASAMSEADRKW